ncbi:STAS domain-containing protein [Actinoplanes siamensis]|uniref:STAS domain-containing protein n=1 Tax=Actinoplanes siamensis TaxID=1223317 RepID=A0A919N5V0_9ACTN|nr:STAS domain-containing protein [Actinoplanes siamensis]GIF04916.1 hypothetical protein Asi03nite_24540 [Actinoplanes siamensis]
MDAHSREQQNLIDAEIRASRRDVLGAFRDRLRGDPGTLVADDFLALADQQVVGTAIMIAAETVADACALQVRDPNTGLLRVARHRGLPPAVLDRLDTITMTPAVLRRAGFRAVSAHTLHDDRGDLLGVLSLHFRSAGRHPEQDRLARAAAEAMASLRSPPELRLRRYAGARTADVTTVASTDGTSTMVIRGALDAITAPGCAAQLETLVAGLSGDAVLVVDLRELDLLAVAGARALVAAAHACEARDVRCYLVAGPGHIVHTVLARLAPQPPLTIVADESCVLTPALPDRRPAAG